MFTFAGTHKNSGGVAIHYVVPVLRMTSCFQFAHNGPMACLYDYNSTTVPVYLYTYGRTLNSHTLRVKCNHLRAAPMTRSDKTRVLGLFGIGPRTLNGDRLLLAFQQNKLLNSRNYASILTKCCSMKDQVLIVGCAPGTKSAI